MWYGQVEGTEIVVLDKRFNDCFAGHVRVERLWTGARWAEGPAWFAAGRYLVWSDIPNNRMMRLVEPSDQVSVFRERSNNSNGNTVDNQGRLVTCEHGARRVTRTEHDGSVTVLADRYNGKRLNSPNDVVVKSDDSIWFTDPPYGILSDYEGNKSPIEQDGCHVYRIDGKSGDIRRVASDFDKPNGIAFSHDYKKVYVCDSGSTHYPEAKNIVWQYDLDGDKLSNPRTLLNMEMDGKSGFPDGMRVDTEGNIWVGAGWVGDGYDGVQVFAPDGERIGQIRLPETCANLCFGGRKRNRLFMTASQSLYALYVETQGAHNC